MLFLIIDLLIGLMITTVLDLSKEINNEVVCVCVCVCVRVCVPENMTHILQLLDLNVNGFEKRFTCKKFSNWYSWQVSKQLDENKPLHNVYVLLNLLLLKPIHVERLGE